MSHHQTVVLLPLGICFCKIFLCQQLHSVKQVIFKILYQGKQQVIKLDQLSLVKQSSLSFVMLNSSQLCRHTVYMLLFLATQVSTQVLLESGILCMQWVHRWTWYTVHRQNIMVQVVQYHLKELRKSLNKRKKSKVEHQS